MEKKDPIIERPEVLSGIRKDTEWSITLMGWIVWFFLFRPLLIVFLWLLGMRILYRHMIQLGGWRSFIDFLGAYLLIIVLIAAVLRGWNLYNLLKFRHKERRQKASSVSDPELEKFFQMSSGDLKKLRQWQEVAIDFLKDARLRFRHPYSTENRVLYSRYRPSRLSDEGRETRDEG